jgi:hypothetical protein
MRVETPAPGEELILRLIPSFQSLPDLLAPSDVERVTNGAIKAKSLASARCKAHAHDIEYFKIGRKIRYPKAAVAAWLLKSHVPTPTV